MKWKAYVITAATALVFATGALSADVVPMVIDQPGTQPQEVGNLESPNKCDNCHGGYNTSQEPAYNWRGSMMANAGRDPIFWATLAVAEQDFDGAGDLCIRCHSTGGWLAGRSTPTDGSGLAAGDSDGVECDYCHKLANPDNSDPVLQGVMDAPFLAYITTPDGTEGFYGSGMGSLWGGSDKLGPYADAEARHQFMKSNFHRSVDFCGTCHDVSNPAVGNLAHNYGKQPTGGSVVADGLLDGQHETKAAFSNPPYAYGIVERTFSEYKSGMISQTLVSDFASLPADLQAGALFENYMAATNGGLTDGNYEDGDLRYFSCQTCHMRAITGQGCNKNPPVRSDLPLHDMTGGNYWMPEAIKWQDSQGKLRLGGGLTATQIAAIDDGALRAKQQLELAATLEVDHNNLKIINHTGHKLITGYPEGRRMWLNIEWQDADGTVLRTDGEYGDKTVTVAGNTMTVRTILDLHPTDGKIYEAHYGLTQEWAKQLVDLGKDPLLPLSFDRVTGEVDYTLGELAAAAPGTEHETFHFVLNNTVVKDNRIPPYGMDYTEAARRNALPVPADQYGNPGVGGAYDYFDVVALNPPPGAVYGDIKLLYQPTSFEYLQFLLLANQGQNAFLAEEGVNMFDAWVATGMAEPHVMATATWGTPPTGGGCNPPAPTLISAVPGNGQVVLGWTDEISGDPSVTGYNVYYDQAGKAQLVADAGAGTAFTDASVNNGTEYCYKVTSYYDATCESPFSNIICAIPNNQGQMDSGVSALTTGLIVKTGKGKSATEEYLASSTFTQGAAVILRATVYDVATGLPLASATVDISITGPETASVTTASSDNNGIAEGTWSTSAPNKRGFGGTTPGTYTATVTNVTAAGYNWDNVRVSTQFTINP